jgi:hypothetical protein
MKKLLSTDHNGNWFSLLSMDKNIGTPLHHWDQNGMEATSLRTLKSMEEKGNHPKEIQMMVAVYNLLD